MAEEKRALLEYTISHFQEIARQNRFAENSAIEHETDRCLICHPELICEDPFPIYLDVITQCVKVRRPSLDQGLVDEINSDLTFFGHRSRVSFESLFSGEGDQSRYWVDWIRDAFDTGLGLLSVHSGLSCEFNLDGAEAEGFRQLIDEKIEELMDYQLQNAQPPPATKQRRRQASRY